MPNKKTKTIEMVGYYISGVVNVNMWGGGSGEIEMKPIIIFEPFLELEKIKEIIPQGLNDNGFGVESFNEATVDIYELYEGSVIELVEDYVQFDGKEVKFECGFFNKGVKAILSNSLLH